MGLLNLIESERTKNILLGIFNVLLLLAVYFLGMYSAHETNKQIEKYMQVYCTMIPNNGFYPNGTPKYGNVTPNITPNITGD